MANFTCCIS